MSDTDGLAAETRRLLDAATKGDWDQVGATVEKEEDVGWCIVVAECDKVADAALIAAAPRLLANWLAREDRLADENRALRDERDRYRQHSVLLNRVSWKLLQATGRVGDGDDKYEHESEELCLEMVAELVEKVDAAQLQSIEARNPGIDMDEVRASRGAAADRGVTDGEAT